MSSPTSVAEWIALRELVKQQSTLNPSRAQIISLRFCAVVTFFSGVLYAQSLLKRRSAGTWIFRKDNEGYWHPNVHTAIPTFAVLYAVAAVCAVFLVENNVGKLIDPVPVLLQFLSVEALQVVVWLRTWAILYTLPSLQHRLQTNSSTSRARNLVSPRVFNAFIILSLMLLPAGQIPWVALTYKFLQKCRGSLSTTDMLFQEVLDASKSEQYGIIYEAALKTFLTLAAAKREAQQSIKSLHNYIIATLAWTFFIATTLLITSSLLLYSIRAQKLFVESALRNRKQLKLLEDEEWKKNCSHSITSWILESRPSTPNVLDQEVSQASDHQFGIDSNPWSWKSLVRFANDEVIERDVSWDLLNKLKRKNSPNPSFLDKSQNDVESQLAPSDDAIVELEIHFKFLTVYWHSTLWQLLLAMGMLLSFIMLQFWLLLRVKSSLDYVVVALVWVNWTWGGGAGLLLGILACILAYSLPQKLPKDPNLFQSIASYLKLRFRKGNTTSSPTSRNKLHENNSMQVLNLSATGALAQSNGQETAKAPVIKMSDYAGNWSISNLGLSRCTSQTSTTLPNVTEMLRQELTSSTYSSFRGHTSDRSQFDEAIWKEPDALETEYLDTEQWDSGHFNAIHALRRGTFRDTQISRRN